MHTRFAATIFLLLAATANASQLDIDANSATTPSHDGQLIIRYLFGFRGNALITDAVGPGATRTTAPAIEEYLASIDAALDVDQNGTRDALTDGLLILRFLSGYTGTSLVTGALAPNATRTSPDDIADYLAGIAGLPAFASDLETDPKTIYVAEQAIVTFAVALANPTGIPTLDLLQTNAEGTSTTPLGTLYDDGDLAKGDDIAGDGVYHNRLPVTSPTTVDVYVRARIPNSGSTTETARLVVAEHLTSTDLAEILAFNTTVDTMIKAALTGGDTWPEARDAALAYVQAHPEMAFASGLSDNGDGLWWATPDGILVAVQKTLYTTDNTRAGSRLPIPAHLRDQTLLVPAMTPALARRAPVSATADDVLFPDSNRALILAPYAFDFEPLDESDEIGTALTEEGFDVTMHRSAAVNVEQFRNLSAYGVIVITSHGDNFYNGIFTLWQDRFGETIPWLGSLFSQVVVLTGVTLTETNRPTYEADLVAQRLVVTASNTLAITPAYVRTYAGKMPGTLVYVGSCRSTYNHTLADAFIDRGAKAFLGYSDYVGYQFAYDTGRATFTQLLEGKTTGEITQVGTSEPGGDHAQYNLIGAQNLAIAGGLRNGLFEAGSLAGWVTEGDARIITQLGPLAPREGTYMSIVSTGLGSVSDSQSSISQRFIVPPTATTLRFEYNVVSEEPLEFVNTQFDDKAEATFTPDGGSSQQLFLVTVNTATWQPIGGIDFAGGDTTTFHTGWQSGQIDLTPYRGQAVTIQLRCYDVGDSIYDTALLIDNARIE